jgi:hypothetical protein
MKFTFPHPIAESVTKHSNVLSVNKSIPEVRNQGGLRLDHNNASSELIEKVSAVTFVTTNIKYKIAVRY